jgi:uncharacterized protein (TIGR03437 family)
MIGGVIGKTRGLTVWLISGSSLFLALYLASRALASYMADPEHLRTLGRIATPLLDESIKETSEWIAAALCFALALLFPRIRFAGLGRLESAFGRFALHRRQAILLCGSLPVIVRLALLPVLRVPEPLVADEFGYLLLANTFASSRLANPTHPLWKFFETIYVLHQPAYASIYPIAPAILLAIPEVFGATPWLGVCLATGLMCALICWMLQAWVPPKWALLGGLLAVCRFTIVSPWMNTYWGGATGAVGGALVLGALPRVMKHRRIRDSLLFGLGLAILAQSRPYEGMLFSIPLLVWLAVWLIQSREMAVEPRVTRVVLPLSAVVAVILASTAFYNWRVTGNALLMPYALHQKIYGTPQPFYWQAAIADAPGVHHQKDIEDVFHWQLEAHDQPLTVAVEGERLLSFWRFYLQPLLTVPLLFLPLLWRDWRLGVLLLSASMLLAGNSLYPFFIPHYAAPLCGLLVLLIVWGLRCLSVIRIRSYRIGHVASRALVLAIGLSGISTIIGGILAPWFVTATDTPRSQALKQLGEGKHVVFVHYGEGHSFHAGIVFNDADIDRSQIVWARDLGAANKELIQYYRDREFWLYNPDVGPDAIAPLGEQPYISGVTDGAGRRDDVRAGVSPGSIAVLWGGNFAVHLHGATHSQLLGSVPVHVINVSPEYGEEFGPGEVPLPKADEKDPIDDLSVQFDGHPAAVLSAVSFSGQESMTVQVPFDVPTGLIPVKVRVGDFVSTKKVPVLPATPGIFQLRMSDSKLRGIVLRPDGSLVDLEHPAHRGDLLRLFATGLGPLNPPVLVNGLGAFSPVAEPAQPLIVGVANRGARMISAKYTASMVGVVEITFEVPPDTPPGADVPLSVAAVVHGQPVYSNKSSLPVQ